MADKNHITSKVRDTYFTHSEVTFFARLFYLSKLSLMDLKDPIKVTFVGNSTVNTKENFSNNFTIINLKNLITVYYYVKTSA